MWYSTVFRPSNSSSVAFLIPGSIACKSAHQPRLRVSETLREQTVEESVAGLTVNEIVVVAHWLAVWKPTVGEGLPVDTAREDRERLAVL